MSRRCTAFGAGLLAVGVYFHSVQSAYQQASVRALAELREELAELRADLAEEQAQRERAIAELEVKVRAHAPPNPVAVTSAAQPADAASAPKPPVVEPADAPAAGDLELQEPRDALMDSERDMMRAFAQDGVDPAWARGAESTIQDKLGGELPRTSTMRAVECRGQMCRIETVHRDAAAAAQFLTDAFKDPNSRVWPSEAFTLESAGPGGEVVDVSYLAREGEALPTLR